MLPVAASVVPADGNLGRRVSRLYAGNLVGSALGALVASGLLLAALGIEFSVRAASLVALATSVLVVLKSPKLHVVTTATALFGAVSILALDPSGGRLVTSFGLYSSAPSYPEYDEYDANGVRDHVASHNLLYYRDGPAATVAVQQVDRYKFLKINGKTDASNRGADVETQMLVGHLPLMAADARHVAVIGWGSGMTAGAVLSHPVESVESVDAFEIEPAVVEASQYFEPSNGRPLNDPRLRLISGDARSLLGRADVMYDLIISHPSNPWITGVANLFTQDFFELATSRLNSDGIFCQWVPLYGMSEESTRSLVGTFRSVFPHTIAFRDRDLILLGSDRPIRFSFQRLLERFQDPRVKQSLEQAFVRYPTDLLVKLRLDEAASRPSPEARPSTRTTTCGSSWLRHGRSIRIALRPCGPRWLATHPTCASIWWTTSPSLRWSSSSPHLSSRPGWTSRRCATAGVHLSSRRPSTGSSCSGRSCTGEVSCARHGQPWSVRWPGAAILPAERSSRPS